MAQISIDELTEERIVEIALEKFPIKNVFIGSSKIVDQNLTERKYFIEGMTHTVTLLK